MTPDDPAVRLAEYVRSLPSTFFDEQAYFSYQHMGAALTDTMLRPGIRYENIKQRIERVWHDYPDARTTEGFLNLLERESPNQLLNFKGQKPLRLMELTRFLAKENVQTEDDLRQWLLVPSNIPRLKLIKGVGEGTVDYLKLASGLQVTAGGSRLMKFLEQAGIDVDDYAEANAIIQQAAAILSVPVRKLDSSIWHYMGDVNS